mmetsp:Transcript_47247/g.110498  ORF Transcript_47247/g.110498 Transcript_47247/m.110498 type:complete len:230 (-) Transcript_47247:88-777(-)
MEDWQPQEKIFAAKDHPEWEGSVSSKFGARGYKRVACHAREGISGIAQKGLSGFMTDVEGKLKEDVVQGKMAHPMSRMRSEEIHWRPGRRVIPHPDFLEPEKITSRPPFVPRKGSWVTLHAAKMPDDKFDSKVDNFAANYLRQMRHRRREKQKQEDRDARRMVKGLDVWEGELRTRRVLSQLRKGELTQLQGERKALSLGHPDTPSTSSKLSGMRGSLSDSMLGLASRA